MKNNCLNNPDHHIWNNNGTYWCHYTVHKEDYTKQRVRVSLGTKDIEIARALRDFIMEATPRIANNIPRSRAQAVAEIRNKGLGYKMYEHLRRSTAHRSQTKTAETKPAAVASLV